jgi:hypothetical protein
MDSDAKKYKVIEFAETHPHILIVVIVILIIIIVMLYFNYGCTKLGSLICGRKKKKSIFDNEDEMDDLIDSINSKQKKKKS